MNWNNKERISLTQQFTPKQIAIEAQICQSYNIDCDFNSYPVIVYGTDLPQTTQHISDALQGISPGFKDGVGLAPNFLKRIPQAKPREASPLEEKGTSQGKPYYFNWYDYEPSCLAQEKGGEARVGDGLTCDEYPFATTAQGGYENYDAYKVSIRLVPDWEQLKAY